MYKKDGHTHTEFCPHGNGDDVEAMIQKAIRFGFEVYSITEHAPLPPDFKQDYEGQASGIDEAAMAFNDLPTYFKKCNHLKQKYRTQIKINVGFELDFLPSQLDWTKAFWAEYGPQTDDNVLSVHFLKGKNEKYWCVDNTPEEYQEGLLGHYKTAQQVYQQYCRTLQQAVITDFGPNSSKRLGHITLCKKFQDILNLPNQLDATTQPMYDALYQTLQQRHFTLDLNTAGLYKPYCNETYPDFQLCQKARALGLPLVYGSDAHSIAAVGGGYHQVEHFLS